MRSVCFATLRRCSPAAFQNPTTGSCILVPSPPVHLSSWCYSLPVSWWFLQSSAKVQIFVAKSFQKKTKIFLTTERVIPKALVPSVTSSTRFFSRGASPTRSARCRQNRKSGSPARTRTAARPSGRNVCWHATRLTSTALNGKSARCPGVPRIS